MSRLEVNVNPPASAKAEAVGEIAEKLGTHGKRERETTALELESILLTEDARAGLELAAGAVERFLRQRNEIRVADALRAIISQ